MRGKMTRNSRKFFNETLDFCEADRPRDGRSRRSTKSSLEKRRDTMQCDVRYCCMKFAEDLNAIVVRGGFETKELLFEGGLRVAALNGATFYLFLDTDDPMAVMGDARFGADFMGKSGSAAERKRLLSELKEVLK